MREIVAGVWCWDWWAEKFGYDFHGWFVPHLDGNVAIDPVEMPDTVLASLKKQGVRRIVITNRNHYRDAQRLREATGAVVMVHRDDAQFVRDKGVLVDEGIEYGRRIGPFTVEPANGKSPGEIALHWEDRKILLVGDCCVGKKPGELGLLPPAVIDDLPQLRLSLEHLAATVDFDVVLCSDGHPVLEDGRAALRKLVASWSA
jgi:glyoxylase-like metal-dependent hydrolase (beta-lactamase superfamily II)